MASAIIDTVRHTVGRRHRITRTEMRDLLRLLSDRGLVELKNGWCRAIGGDYAAGWAAACRGITVISVLADTDPVEARLASSNPGSIRYDDPGSMHPLLRATLMCAPADTRNPDYLRARTARLLLVVDDAGVAK